MATHKAVLGVVTTQAQANAAVERLQAMGFRAADVSMLVPDKRGARDFGFVRHSKLPEGLGLGGLLGGAVGFVAGMGIGPSPLSPDWMAAIAHGSSQGPVVLAMAFAAAAALVGAVVGAIVGFFMPEIEARHFEGRSPVGDILVAAHAESREAVRRARAVLDSVAASDVTAAGENTPYEARP